MKVILTENKLQALNYIQMLEGTNKILSQLVTIVVNPKVLPEEKYIMVAYLPSDLFRESVQDLKDFYNKQHVLNILHSKSSLTFRLKREYIQPIQQLYQEFLKYNVNIYMATNDTLQGEFLGTYFLKKYHLEAKVIGRIVPFAQTHLALRYALGHPHSFKYHIQYATAYYNILLQHRLSHYLLTGIMTKEFNKRHFQSIVPTYLMQYFLLKRIQRGNQIKHDQSWQLCYKDSLGTLFKSTRRYHCPKLQMREMASKAQQHPLIISQAPKSRIMRINPPLLLNHNALMSYLQKNTNSTIEQIQSGLAEAYWKYHLISYPYTNHHRILQSQFNILKTNLGWYYQQLCAFTERHIPKSIFTYYQPRSQYVIKSKMKAQQYHFTAIIPVRTIKLSQINKLPKLVKLIYEAVIKHVVLMFSQPVKYKRTIINAHSYDNTRYKAINKQIINTNWYALYGYTFNQHLVDKSTYKKQQHIHGRFIYKAIKQPVINKKNQIINNKVLAGYSLKQRVEIFSNLVKNHIIKVTNDGTVCLLLNGKAELSYFNQILSKNTLMTNSFQYEKHLLVTSSLIINKSNTKFIEKRLINDIKSMIILLIKLIDTKHIVLKEQPPAPKKIFLQNNRLQITCPNCHKSHLIYQEYKTKRSESINKRYYCPHCKMELPTRIGSFKIYSGILPFIFNNMFAPAMITINGTQTYSVIKYKNKHFYLKHK